IGACCWNKGTNIRASRSVGTTGVQPTVVQGNVQTVVANVVRGNRSLRTDALLHLKVPLLIVGSLQLGGLILIRDAGEQRHSRLNAREAAATVELLTECRR